MARREPSLRARLAALAQRKNRAQTPGFSPPQINPGRAEPRLLARPAASGSRMARMAIYTSYPQQGPAMRQRIIACIVLSLMILAVAACASNSPAATSESVANPCANPPSATDTWQLISTPVVDPDFQDLVTTVYLGEELIGHRSAEVTDLLCDCDASVGGRLEHGFLRLRCWSMRACRASRCVSGCSPCRSRCVVPARIAASSLLKFDIRADEDANAKNLERMKSKRCDFQLGRMWSFLMVSKGFSTNC